MNRIDQIDKNILNSDVNYCIREYVRLVEHRDMLREKWFYGYTLEELAAKYHLSVSRVKKVIYGIGDDILIRASKMHPR